MQSSSLKLLGLGLVLGAGLAAAAQQPDASPYAGMRWRSIGPYRSGNVYAVAGVPGDPTVYYLGLPEGGVWKTSDGGTVWKPIFDQQAVPSIGSVAVAASEPSTVYAGTGDPTGWSFTPGEGMFKSTDAGATWQRIGLADTQYIPALLVDPRNPAVVLAGAETRGGFGATGATGRGAFLSTDGGQRWQQTFSAAGVSDMAWDYADPAVVYLVAQVGGFGRGGGRGPGAGAAPEPVIYKSSDEGATWQPLVSQGLPARIAGGTIAVASGTHGQRVYLLTGGLAGGRAAGVFRSDDGGATWSLGTAQIGSAGGRIYVDPSNPDVVYLMGTSIYLSRDGAHTFTAFKGAPGGDDYRALWIDPANPRRMIAGVDQGPSITVDAGRTWTSWYNLPNGQFYDVFTDNQFPYQVYGAQQDSGTAAVRSRSDYGGIRGSDWMPVSGFEFGDIAPDPLDPRWVYTQGWYDVLRRFDRTTGQIAVVFTPEPGDHFTNLPPTMFSPVNPRRLYLASQYLRATDDGGRTWVKLSPDLTARPAAAVPAAGRGAFGGRGARPGAISALAPSPLSAPVIWAGTSNGLIQLSRDGGHTWKNVSPPQLTPRSSVTNLDASHHDAARAYVAVEEAGSSAPLLYRTSDYGQSWQAIVTGLPGDVRTRVVREDPEDANLLYAGTEMGAWVSFDRGDQWQPLQLNLPHTVVSDMKVHGDDLVVSTYGRSLWILDDVTPLRQVSQARAASAVYLYRPETAWRVRWDNDQDTPLPPEVPMGQNAPEGAVIDYYLKNPAQGPMKLAIYDPAGRLVNEYTDVAPPPDNSPPNVPDYWFKPAAVLDPAAGMHRFVWDLRYPTPKALTYSYYGNMLDYTEYTLTWHAILGNTPRETTVGPLAIPGTYQLKLTVNGQTYARPLTIKNDPRSPATQADLAAQLALEERVMAGLAVTYDTYYQIDRVRQALAAVPGASDGNAALADAAAALERQLAPLAAGTGASGFGVANRDLARRLQDLEFGDYDPTSSDINAVDASCGQITQAAQTLGQITRGAVPQVNQLLAANDRARLPTLSAPAGAPCGR